MVVIEKKDEASNYVVVGLNSMKNISAPILNEPKHLKAFNRTICHASELCER